MEKDESFESFKNSFSYGARSDLNFKFLKHLPDDQAAAFFQELLWEIGEALNDGGTGGLAGIVQRWQEKAYSGTTTWAYSDGPFTPLSRPLSETTLALFTSSGHFMAGDDPCPFGIENMTQAQAEDRIGDFIRSEALLSSIPVDVSAGDLCVRHGGYDIRPARLDFNTVFPLDPLKKLAAAGRVRLHPWAYSFVGAAAQTPLLNTTGPKWAGMLKEAGVQAVLLVPV